MNMGSNIRIEGSIVEDLANIRDGLRQSATLTVQAPTPEAGSDFANKILQAFGGQVEELLPTLVISENQLRQSWRVIMKIAALLEKSYSLQEKHKQFREATSAGH